MNILEEVIQKQKEYEAYMNSIDINQFEQFTRKQLLDFVNKSREFKQRFITLEVDKIIEKKKFEEYPELLGVHHYPELKEIDFLSQEQLIELDKELAHNRGVNANVSFKLKSYIHWDLHDKVYDFLIEKGIIKKEIHVECSCGRSEWLSRAFDEKFKEQWIEDLKKSNSECEAVGLLTQREFEFFGYCEECEEYYEFGNLDDDFIKDLSFHHFYVKIKERDKRWDNI